MANVQGEQRKLCDYTQESPEANFHALADGPGTSAMQDSAAEWRALSQCLIEAARIIARVLAKLEVGWQGEAAQRLVTTVKPFMRWLSRASGIANDTADRILTVKAAYETALNAMTPLHELQRLANEKAKLVGDNFGGINAAAIAENEATYQGHKIKNGTARLDYVRTARETTEQAYLFPDAPTIISYIRCY
ncbi:PPE domain-containing protein [Mycobacterium haemophilum]